MKKKNLIFLAFVALSVLAIISFSGCTEPDPEYTVKYEITGPATVASLVVYYNSTNGTTQINDVNIPWSLTVTISGKNIPAGFSAGLKNSNASTYTANVYVNGQLKASSSSTSEFVSVNYVIQ